MLLEAPTRSFLAQHSSQLVRLAASKPGQAEEILVDGYLNGLRRPGTALLWHRIGSDLPVVLGRKELKELARRLIVHSIRSSTPTVEQGSDTQMSELDGLYNDNLLVQTSGTTPTLEGLSGEWEYYNNPAPGFFQEKDDEDEEKDASG